MKKLCTIGILSLAALGVGAGQASAWHLLHHCCCSYTVCCKPYNAFSPPCCTPCGKNWPCDMGHFQPAPCFGMGGYGGCGSCGGGPAMSPPGVAPMQMPPATGAPNYMPPAPAEVGAPEASMPMMPMMPYAMQGGAMPMQQPVAFQPPYMNMNYYPPQAYYPAYPPTQMAGYGMPQGPMPAYFAGPR
jgi:hypothetical protein